MVIRRSLVAGTVGVVVGLPVAIMAGRLLRSSLYGLAPGDPLTFVAALAGILLVCLVASWIAAHTAASVDPLSALRYE